MAQGTVIHVAPEQPTYAVCVLGTETQLDVCGSAPPGCTFFSINASPGVVVDVAHSPPAKKNPTGSSKWPLDPGLEVSLRMTAASSSMGDRKVQISYYGPQTNPVHALLYLTGVEITLSADVTRTGKVKPTKAGKNQSTWTWGPRGQGAILLVNCDRDNPHTSAMDCTDDQVLDGADVQDMSLVTLSTRTPPDFFSKHQLVLHVAKSEMDKVRVFQASRGKQPSGYQAILGPQQPSHLLELPGGQHSTDFYVEGLTFPDANFPGLIFLTISLFCTDNPELPKTLVFQDSVAFRVAPWIMTPNTQPPKEVYVCRIFDNEDFVKSLTTLTKKARCKLTVYPLEESMEDQWMQDEIEIGYTQAPHKALPVVFDSPRNRGLKEFPIKCLLGPDFGYVTRGPQTGGVTDLDSFGNLEVSPPVTVGKKKYPLGRILIGHSSYPSAKSQEMHQALQDFLAAQQVQAPVKLYSDWLYVGHVDEFLSFVPAHKGFRLLLASPRSCYKLFQEQLKEGHGEALLFEGIKYKRQQKIKDILSNKKLREHNSYVESCIDWNREVLKRELGLRERDIVDIPQLFKLRTDFTGTPKAEALFPNMVNMLVLGKYLGIPKPFGPIINGRCCLEEKVRSLLEPLGLHCVFIDDFTPYHLQHGEVHCGTNVRRQPFSFKWWHMVP
ncbi:PREDICTED: protein-arginine deiminase type-4 isoform X2 [Myotis davidii]|uniref:Protein-arginine deiminase n=1 Tax=Myotis davidii TaxID=225400 RepID=L5LPK0_MYODS|nr:PREDICTED: protein-arginine deiminase type-4 isoform X2 [Myotis davidii]ELK27940.1 Protein-arginine deiminase type-4 [Myotis davidii]